MRYEKRHKLSFRISGQGRAPKLTSMRRLTFMLRASGCTGCRANGSTLEVFSATNRADTALRIAGLADLAFMKDVQYRQTGRTPERSEYLIKLLAARRH